ncbi:hypothetical protein [Deinococcus ruber]|uniref:Uncharacterized protein n=1 Tax=Deinococcus ruber TaxID=1848197 RepID=A0A918C7F1_9DEIO|nr:hypothetical protein [Deinococcus ruber]GGR09582.1 hypothetical protein GCM10008957_22900 [Deinococcus ruber]
MLQTQTHADDFIDLSLPHFGSGVVTTLYGVRVSYSTQFATPDLLADAVDELADALKTIHDATSDVEARRMLLFGGVEVIRLGHTIRRRGTWDGIQLLIYMDIQSEVS